MLHNILIVVLNDKNNHIDANCIILIALLKSKNIDANCIAAGMNYRSAPQRFGKVMKFIALKLIRNHPFFYRSDNHI